MGKRKRPSNFALSQEEIWDDSALIRSWDEAVAEYEFYHSIAARGEDVEEVLRLAELDEEGGAVANGTKDTKVVAESGGPPIVGKGEVVNEELEDGEVDDGGGGDVNSGLNRHAGEGAGRSGIVGHQLLLPPKSAPADAEKREKGKAPHTLTSEMDASAQATETTDPGRDQILENIKMAYWWAGYYSGLYEGQQQGTRASTR